MDMTDPRLAIEVSALAPFFPKFRWYQHDGAVFTEGPIHTNSGRLYGLRVVLERGYPNTIPTAIVTYPKPLLDHHGEPLAMRGESSHMHILRPQDGMVTICHYPAWTWTPQRTVYQVVVKARIWFEAYELHLARGEWIDSWLGHAPA